MFNNSSDHFLSFVWPPQSIGPDVMNIVQSTSSRAIFDLSSIQPSQFTYQLKAVAATEVKISIDDFMSSALDDFLVKSGIQTIWVEYFPAFHNVTPEVFLARWLDLETRCALYTHHRRLETAPKTQPSGSPADNTGS